VEIIVVPVVLYGYEAWILCLWEEHISVVLMGIS
jgi:hypothetical protein